MEKPAIRRNSTGCQHRELSGADTNEGAVDMCLKRPRMRRGA